MINLLTKIGFFSMLICFTAIKVSGQESEKVSNYFQLSLEELSRVVITPSKLPQSAGNVTQKVDVINRLDIETTISGMRNLCELISRLPGVSVSILSRNDANWGTYGGIGPKYSTYMLQGLPIDAFMDPMSLDLNTLQRVEVQRGPASVLYPNYLSQDFAGNQSPLAGTVNLILKEKVKEQQTIFTTSAGSYNTLNAQGFHENKVGPLNYFCGTTYEISDYTNYGSPGSWLNMQKNPAYRKAKLYGGLTWFLDKEETQKVSVFVQQTWNDGDAGRIYRNFTNLYGTVNVGYTAALSKRLYFQSHLGLRSYNRSWQESNFGMIDTLKSNNGVSQSIVPIDFSFTWSHGKSSGLSIGADNQNAAYLTWSDPMAGYRITGNKSSASQTGIYIQEEWRPTGGFLIRGGLRYAYITNDIYLTNGRNPDKNSVSWQNILWSAGSRYSISNNFTVFANAGSSFSPPGLKSTAGTISLNDFGIIGRNGQLPNPDLKPENGMGFDAGVDLSIGKKLKIGFRGFYTNLRNAIVDNVVFQNPSQSQSINSGSASSRGGEVELNIFHSEFLSWFANITCMITKNRNQLDANQDNVEIPFSSKVVLNLGAAFTTPFGLTIVPLANYNSGFYDGTSMITRTFYKPGLILNTYISQRLANVKTFSLECFAQLYNLTNNRYEMPWQFRNTGFSSQCGIRVAFK
jgi:iron complex outermembrane recepter protein